MPSLFPRTKKAQTNPNTYMAKKFFLYLLTGSLLIYVLISLSTLVQGQIKGNSVVKQWTSQLSADTFSTALSMEIPLLANYNRAKGVDMPNLSTFFLEMITSFNPTDPRTLIRRELPGFAFFDGELIVPGAGGHYTDIPVESAPPLEVVMAEREAIINELKGIATQDQPKEEKVGEVQQTTGGRDVVFIYHTHNRESWLPHVQNISSADEAFHPEVNITKVGLKLAEELEKRGIGTYVDTTDIAQKLKDEDLPFSLSYAKSREVVQEVLATQPDVKFVFDLHRDSLTRERTTVEIDGLSFARTFFVVGGRNQNYEKNLDFAQKLHDMLEESYPGLSRGVYLKEGGNGEYNQSLSENNVLIEVGGVENTIDESFRSAVALADVIADIYWDALKVDAQPTNVGRE